MFPLFPSILIFGPQGCRLTDGELSSLQNWLCQTKTHLQWVRDLEKIPEIWDRYIQHTPELTSLHGQSQIQCFMQWAKGSGSLTTESLTSGLVAVPLLVILQLAQYYHFLELRQSSHKELIDSFGPGSVQGYCSGFLTAAAIVSSGNAGELDTNATAAIYLAIGIGAYSDLMNQDSKDEANLLTVRLAYSTQEEELLQRFKDV
jgi:malonyl CoA-acyl carrier protein transacylase